MWKCVAVFGVDYKNFEMLYRNYYTIMREIFWQEGDYMIETLLSTRFFRYFSSFSSKSRDFSISFVVKEL